MEDSVSRYFRCPVRYLRFETAPPTSAINGYFRIGPGATGYGGYRGRPPARHPADEMPDALHDVRIVDGKVRLPFDPGQVAENLRCELYTEDWRASPSVSLLAQVYYFVRPLLPTAIRRHLQRLYLGVRGKSVFPHWPVDSSVDDMFGHLLWLLLKALEIDEIPFIWFWPEGAPGAAFVTHDVESEAGRDNCSALMDIDDSFGIKASFQIVPEQRYAIDDAFIDSIRSRGFELCIHDLNHDGHLYKNREQFLERATKINSYAAAFNADGFRAAVLYRKQLWYDALRFEFDMSVPNVATHDPQRGGCCTVMPYFIGDILELPVTMSQDYALFHILGAYSIDIWKQQIELLLARNGLISCIVHPDYVMGPRERQVYEQLLAYLIGLRDQGGVWIATPQAVNRWWRSRSKMSLVEESDGWHIAGADSARARIAFAREENGHLVYRLQAKPGDRSPSPRAFPGPPPAHVYVG
jgi:hypothetical protein